MAKIKAVNEKEIIALDTFEAVRLRSEMYIGQVKLFEEKLPLIIDNKIINTQKKWSQGFFHLLVEIFENAIDEAKRCKGKMKDLTVCANLDTNEITVKDTGSGFFNAEKIHKKTNKNVVRTAMEELHAGSNFIDSSINVLGTHGVGSAITNILSKKFYIETINETHKVLLEWEDYKLKIENISKSDNLNTGTTIKFTPSPEVFGEYKWDKDILLSYLKYKKFLITKDSVIYNLQLHFDIIENGLKTTIEINDDFIPKEHISVKTSLGLIYVWESYENSTSISFVNGSQCTGIHQKIVNDWINDYLGYNLSHHFYETLVILNVPSHLMRFNDQNKTKYGLTRGEIEDELKGNFYAKLIKVFSNSMLKQNIEKKIEERLSNENLNKIKKVQKTSKRKITDKFSPSSKHKDNLFLVEGLSAAGGLKQGRNIENDAIYALRGKVKNAKKLSDLANNTEWLDIMSILEIEPYSNKKTHYNKIIIFNDADADGYHIASLIINFFSKWFPDIIEQNKLYLFVTPVISCIFEKNIKYFNSLEEFSKFNQSNKVTNVRYLKGLGSLSLDDWKTIMKNRVLFKVTKDKSANKMLDIIFGDNTAKKKLWLSEKI